MTVRFGALQDGDTFRLMDDRAAVVTQVLAKVAEKRAVIAGGVAWFDMHPDTVVEVAA